MHSLPTATPELVATVAHNAYRLRLDTDRDREKFDALPEKTQRGRAMAFEAFTRAVLISLGCPEPERRKPEGA